MSIAFVTGPVRSGKSRFAAGLAAAAGGQVVYVATARRDPGDVEFEARVERHRRDRPPSWRVVETAHGPGTSLSDVISQATPSDVLLVDSLGTWLASLMQGEPATNVGALALERHLDEAADALLEALERTRTTCIFVGEEVGWGIVPLYASARVFRDVLGRLQQRIAARAERAYLLVCGVALDLLVAGASVVPLEAPLVTPAPNVFSTESFDLPALVASIAPANAEAARRARARIDALTKPVESLGRIETLAVSLAAIAGAVPEHAYVAKAILIGAADHGVAGEGVSAFPAEVTAQMVGGFLDGHAAINAFARTCAADVYVVDFGIATSSSPHPMLLDRRIAAGTGNLAREPALAPSQVDAALAAGASAVEEICSRRAYDVFALGEMGIGNTTSAAAVVAALTAATTEQAVGRGTGIDDDRLRHKRSVVTRALARFDARDWRSVAGEVGGFEIVGLAGAMLALARCKIPIVLDGFIVAAAALLATRIAPAVREYLIAAHRSQEPGHRIALEALDLRPLLDLDLRLGEATGAALALPLVETATRMLCEMQTFAEAGVSTEA